MDLRVRVGVGVLWSLLGWEGGVRGKEKIPHMAEVGDSENTLSKKNLPCSLLHHSRRRGKYSCDIFAGWLGNLPSKDPI